MTRTCHIPGCGQPAATHITGTALPKTGVNVCNNPSHYDQVFNQAGQYKTAQLIVDDPQQTLFDLPEQGDDRG